MARKQQPNIPAEGIETPAECATGEWVESLGRTFGFGMIPVPYMGWMSLVEMQRRNVDALEAVNRIAMEGALAVAECQCRVLHEMWGQFAASGQDLLEGKFAGGALTAQIESVRLASERFLADTKAFSSLVAKTNTGVSQVVQDRLAEMVEEIGQLVASQIRT